MDTQAVITHIVRWLDEYAARANAKGFVVGVSGGIDSAVVSALAARTGRTTLLLDMPIRQHPDQLERARLHIRNLQRQYANVSAQTVDLTDTFQTFEQTVGV
ncbi:NAD synthase family protein, partial [Neisseria meningitidis 97018]